MKADLGHPYAPAPMAEPTALEVADEPKARGAFFTPQALTTFIIDWAVRSPTDRVLEPSCGEAAFLLVAAERLRELGAPPSLAEQLHGIELHEPSARSAREALQAAGSQAYVHSGDFFDFPQFSVYDAVVGNPPYVRYQDFSGASRTKARRAALEAGVRLSGLASSWAAFTVRAAGSVSTDGRLGLVLPAELLWVNYAAPVRRFLMERFANVQLVMFDERVFPGALEEVVLLLAEGEGPTDRIAVSQTRNADDLSDLLALDWRPEIPTQKWTPALLDAAPLNAYSTLSEDFDTLEQWGRTDLGMVTGNNRYFTLSRDEVEGCGLPERELERISPPGSAHLRGLRFTDTHWRELAEEGRRVYLFRPPSEAVSPQGEAFIESGRKKGYHKAYKCKVRTPWWRVPWVQPPDLFLTYMNHDTPRLVANEAGVPHLNSVHGVTLEPEYAELGRTLLPVASLNSLTLLGAELVGRSYGGGLLKVEPREADVLPVPSPTAVSGAAAALAALAEPISLLLQRGKLLEAVRMVDQVLLVDHLGASREQVAHLREGHGSMFGRRAARGRG